MNTRCRDCQTGLDHCHGMLINHSLQRPECTEDGCTSPEHLRHAFSIDCEAVGCGCSEAESAKTRAAAPSDFRRLA
jgi:hypothetical protein